MTFRRLAAAIALPSLVAAGCGGDDEGLDETDAPSADELTVVDMGSHSVFDTGGLTGDIELVVPDGAVSTVVWKNVDALQAFLDIKAATFLLAFLMVWLVSRATAGRRSEA